MNLVEYCNVSKSSILVSLLIYAFLTDVSNGVVKLSLNGDDWFLFQVSGSISAKAQVPGCVHMDLWRNDVIKDPYYRFNDIAYSWISYSNWKYIKTFTASADMFKHSQQHLLFGGLDTVAQISLNDVVIGRTYNMFTRFDFDVTKVLKEGTNKLEIEFQSPVMYARQKSLIYPYDVPPDCPPDAQNGECHFNFIRKSAASFSWDWGPSYPTMGIWKNVSLLAYNSSAISYITTETTRLEGTTWQLKAAVFFDGNPNGHIEFTIGELNVMQRVVAASNPVVFTVDTYEVNPWWPNGYGAAVLYGAKVTYNGLTGDTDEKALKIGFRTVELIQDPISHGDSFYFQINGVPVFAKGSNWIPADSFQDRIQHSYLERLLKSASEANMNMLRVWGGGVYESEDFYQLADELGIMIWQDFMFACALYPTDAGFIQSVADEVTHQIRRLKRHPSIVIWSGNNENEGALSNNWYDISKTDYPRYLADYIKLYVDTIHTIVLQEDVSRPFVPSSPSNGIETIAEGWVAKDPQSPFYGDVHDYNYTRNSWDWQLYTVPRFASEFGIESWCSLETLEPVSIPSVDWDMDSSFVKHRQHHGDGEAQMLNETLMHLSLMDSNNATTKFSDFVYLTQINQAVGIKTEVELYRRSQSNVVNGYGLTMGAMYWQLNDIWQAPTWASIEYGGKWKMLHYYAKKFFNSKLVSPIVDNGNVTLYYIDDDMYRMSTGHKHDNSLRFAAGDQVTILGKCYSWKCCSFLPQYQWQITFQKPKVASASVYSAPLNSLLSSCHCNADSNCFFYFTDPTTSAPDAFLFHGKLPLVTGSTSLVEITNVELTDRTTAEILLVATGISAFVWLDAPGFSGRFSDNGFIMVESHMSVKFHSWIELVDVTRFTKSLTVKALADPVEA